MKCLIFLLLSVLALSIDSKYAKKEPRLRALWNLEEVTECELHYNALHYNNYGCWCGVGGSHTPVDGIDECCMHHDKCYDKAVDDKICINVEVEYIEDYTWHCLNSTAFCSEKNSGCKAALCDCDKKVVDCWRKFPKPEKKAKCNRSLWAAITEHFQI